MSATFLKSVAKVKAPKKTSFQVAKYSFWQLAKNLKLFQVLNILQSCSMAFEVVDENNVYTCVGHPLKSDISNIVDWMLNDTFVEAYDKVQNLKIIKGLSLQVPLHHSLGHIDHKYNASLFIVSEGYRNRSSLVCSPTRLAPVNTHSSDHQIGRTGAATS